MDSASNLPAVDSRFQSQTYLLKRRILKLVGSDFMIYDPSGRLCFFVNQKGFKLKEDITVFSDETKSQALLSIKARQIMDFSASYDIVDAVSGQRIGVFKRKGWNSILRDEWVICDGNEIEIATLIEDSMIFALLRRFLSNLIPQNYDVLMGGIRVVDLRQNFNPFSYHLNIDLSQRGSFDPRLGIVAAVMLAAIEGRQR